MLAQANAVIVSELFPPILGSIGTYQHRSVGSWVHFCVLVDVPAQHPRGHDEKRKQRLRNLDDREYVGMGNAPAPILTTEGLGLNALRTPLTE